MIATTGQARVEKLVKKFGGAKELAEGLRKLGIKKDPSTVYRWSYPRKLGGTGGQIPIQLFEPILKVARDRKIKLSVLDKSVFIPITRVRKRARR